jgi:hypothetical protein
MKRLDKFLEVLFLRGAKCLVLQDRLRGPSAGT